MSNVTKTERNWRLVFLKYLAIKDAALMSNSVNSIFFPFPSVILVAPLQSIWFNRHNAETQWARLETPHYDLSMDTAVAQVCSRQTQCSSTLCAACRTMQGSVLDNVMELFDHHLDCTLCSTQCTLCRAQLHIVQHTVDIVQHNCTRPNCQCCSPLPLPLGEKLPISMTFWD